MASKKDNRCDLIPNAQICNKTTSAKGDWVVNKSLAIASDSNSVTIKQADFAEIVTKVGEDGEVAFRIQDHKQSNPAYNTTAAPAIVVKFTYNEEAKIIRLDTMESLPGTEFDKEEVSKRYTLIVDSEMFFTYGFVVENDLKVAQALAEKKRIKKTIDLT